MRGYRVSWTTWCIAAGFAGLVLGAVVEGQGPPPPPPPVPFPPPPALNQVVVPDVNRLGLLDCAGPDAVSTADAQHPTLAAPFTGCGQYLGFPITKTGQRDNLVALGKALFWDMQVGSDGTQACATCHFHAGADSRTVNQLSPGLNRVSATQAAINAAINPSQLAGAPDFTLNSPGANGALTHDNFPRASNPASAAAPGFGNNDVTSSQGVRKGSFLNADSVTRVDNGTFDASDAPFAEGNHTIRRVEPRNTPTTIGAGYNLRNFWDGRANMFFNGVNPFGMLDPSARVWVKPGAAAAVQQQVQVPFSSLASQAVGPPGSPFEMSLDGRNLAHIGHKLLDRTGDHPLIGQKVDPTDSVLGGLANTSAPWGLTSTYRVLINQIFQDKFTVGDTPTGAPLIEENFGLFFGLAVQAYEATLVPDRTPLDPILAFMTPLLQQAAPIITADQALTAATNQCAAPGGIPGSSLTVSECQTLVAELRLFLNPAVANAAPGTQTGTSCVVCHVNAEFTGATVSTLTGFGRPVAAALAPPAVPEAVALVERMIMGDGTQAVYDSGFYNIGVRPTADDLSIFGRTPGNVPFSIGMLSQEILRRNPSTAPVAALLASGNLKQPAAAVGFPNFTVDLNPLPVTGFVVGCAPPNPNAKAIGVVRGNGCAPLGVNERIAIRGSFKTSTLRNVKFMGPFFHNGGRETVRDVIAGHYNAGGIFNLAFNPQNCALKPNGTSATKGCLNGQVDFDPAIVNLNLTGAQIDQLTHLIEFGLTDPRVAKEQGPFDHPQLCVPVGHNGDGTTSLADVPAVGQGGNGADLQTFSDALDHSASKAHNLVAGSCTMPLDTLGYTSAANAPSAAVVP